MQALQQAKEFRSVLGFLTRCLNSSFDLGTIVSRFQMSSPPKPISLPEKAGGSGTRKKERKQLYETFDVHVKPSSGPRRIQFDVAPSILVFIGNVVGQTVLSSGNRVSRNWECFCS
ncbi:hypothetical protein I3760_01G035000 [Carya illinoinensis]|nr:hypothetical protein I3760_01G035000 [Carya illinoinensis]